MFFNVLPNIRLGNEFHLIDGSNFLFFFQHVSLGETVSLFVFKGKVRMIK